MVPLTSERNFTPTVAGFESGLNGFAGVAELLLNRGEEPIDVIHVGDIAGDRERTIAMLRHERVEFVRRPGEDTDSRTARGKRLGRRRADAGRCPGHHGDASFEILFSGVNHAGAYNRGERPG